MALIDQRLDEKAVDEKSLIHWLNNQLRPVVRKMRDVVNARAGGYYAETFGDGAATVFVVSHGLGSRDVLAQFYDTATLLDLAPTSIERTDVDTITATFGAPPALNGARAVVRL